MQVFLVFALLIALVAVVFAVQNTAMVTISFLVWDFNNSLAIIILLTIFTGVLISILMSTPGWVKNRFTLSSLRKKVKELDTKLSKTETQYQAALQELELYKVPPVVETPAPLPEPVVTAPSTSTVEQEVPDVELPPAEESLPFETSMPDQAAEPQQPVKKSKFPGIDRILNR